MDQLTKNYFIVWLVFFVGLVSLFLLQGSFLSFVLQPFLVPYVLWPFLLYFFLYKSILLSCILLLAVSALSSVFLSLSISALFFIYLFLFTIIVAIKQFFFPRAFAFFVGLVFLFSFCFPYFIEGAYGLSRLNFSFPSILFYFCKSFITCILSICVFPILKKYFPPAEGV